MSINTYEANNWSLKQYFAILAPPCLKIVNNNFYWGRYLGRYLGRGFVMYLPPPQVGVLGSTWRNKLLLKKSSTVLETIVQYPCFRCQKDFQKYVQYFYQTKLVHYIIFEFCFITSLQGCWNIKGCNKFLNAPNKFLQFYHSTELFNHI